MIQMLTEKKFKTKQVKRPEDQDHQEEESKDKIMPVMTVALGAIKKGLVPNLKSLPGHHSTKELQKFMLMSTAHIIRNVLEYEYITLNFR